VATTSGRALAGEEDRPLPVHRNARRKRKSTGSHTSQRALRHTDVLDAETAASSARARAADWADRLSG
jgi:hypothetical protein